MKKGKIIFIAGLLSQPRCIKRVKAFLDDGFECDVYGYDRGKYDINNYPEEVKLIKWGKLEDGGAYLGKVKKMFCDIKKCVRQYKGENVVFYAFGFMPAIILRLLNQRYIYEISDILYAYPRFKRILGLLKIVDKSIIKKSVATVLTSGGFFDFYNLKYEKIFVVPNKVSTLLSRDGVRALQVSKEHLSFGFVGAIRYESVFRFAETIGKYYPQHTFHFFGGTILPEEENKLLNLQKTYDNVISHGTFKNPTDLPDIYSQIDIVVSCYTVSSLNEQLAEPNKLYEAIFYCRPIVVSDGIYLSDRVRELDCGFCIDASSEETIRDFIENIDIQRINTISEHELNKPKSEFVSNQSDLHDWVENTLKSL